MFQEKRPTCVTVIGWAWIIIGGFMCFSSLMALLGFVIINEMAQYDLNSQPVFRITLPLVVLQISIASLGIISGINFLKLKAWSRVILEGLTLVLLLILLGFTFFWAYNWLFMSSQVPYGFGVLGAAMGLVIAGIYGVPLGIMLKYLRGPKVKNAMGGFAESTTPANEPSSHA